MLCSILFQCCAAFIFNGVGVTAAHCMATVPKHRVVDVDLDADVLCFDPTGYRLPSPTEGVTTAGARLVEHTSPGYLRFDRDVVAGNSGSGIIIDRTPRSDNASLRRERRNKNCGARSNPVLRIT